MDKGHIDVSTENMSKEGGYTKDDAYKSLERVIYWVNNCDTKASILIAFVGIIVALFGAGYSNFEYLKNFGPSDSQGVWQHFKFIIVVICLVLFACFLFMIVKHILAVLRAKTHYYDHEISERNYKLNDKYTKITRSSLIHFKAISMKSLEDFKYQINKINYTDLMNDINNQIYYNSLRVSEKYDNYNKALYYSVFLFVVSIVFTFISYF